MSLMNKSLSLGNRMTLLGRSVNISTKIFYSTDSRNPYGGDYDRYYGNNTSGTMNYCQRNNQILSTYENDLNGADPQNTCSKTHDWNEQTILKTYRSNYEGKDNHTNTYTKYCYGNDPRPLFSYGDHYEGYVQINTYDGYHGNDHTNMYGNTFYGKVLMSTHQGSNDGYDPDTIKYEVNQPGNDNTTCGGYGGGNKQQDTSGGNKNGKESGEVCSLAPICLSCAGPCPSRPTKYDSRKFKPNLPKNDVCLNFEGLRNIPSGVFRHTSGECLGRHNAAKCTCYQNPEYFSFHNMTFFDMHLVMRPMRRPCPRSGRKP